MLTIQEFLVKACSVFNPVIEFTDIGIHSIVTLVTAYTKWYYTCLDPAVLGCHNQRSTTISGAGVTPSFDVISGTKHVIRQHKICWLLFPGVKHMLAVSTINIRYSNFHQLRRWCLLPVLATPWRLTIGQHHRSTFISKENLIIIFGWLKTYWSNGLGVFDWATQFDECYVTVHVCKLVEVIVNNNPCRVPFSSTMWSTMSCTICSSKVHLNSVWSKFIPEIFWELCNTVSSSYDPFLRNQWPTTECLLCSITLKKTYEVQENFVRGLPTLTVFSWLGEGGSKYH